MKTISQKTAIALLIFAAVSVWGYAAERFSVHHESPQVLLIRNGECVYVESHNGIDVDEINAQAEA